MKIELTQNQKMLIQKVVKVEEMVGSTTSASTILGLILVTGNAGLTFEDIRETLNLSKGAVSLGINLLIGIGELESFKKIGERKRYFRLPNLSLKHYIGKVVALCYGYKDLATDLLKDETIEFTVETRNKMKENLELMSFVIQEINNSIKKLKELDGYEK